MCRAQALVDLIGANASVEAHATFLVPVSTPHQAALAQAADGLGGLLAQEGFQVGIAPQVQDIPAEWVTSPDDRSATPGELDAFLNCHPPPRQPERPDQSDVPSPHTASPGAGVPDHEPTEAPMVPGTAELQPWRPPDTRVLSNDPDTARATMIGQITDRLQTLNNQATDSTLRRDRDGACSTGGITAGGVTAGDGLSFVQVDDVIVDGVGVIHAETVAGLIAALGTRIGRALVDPGAGTVREHRTDAYRPTGGMRRLIRTRDGSCRFPGCARPAEFTDADHVIPYARGGQTSPANLISLCRTHHRAEGSGAWRVVLNEDDTITWTSLAGTTHITWPATDPAPF